MSRNKTIVATDVGSSKVVTLVAQIDDIDGFHINGSGESISVGIEKGIVLDGNRLGKSLRDSISLAETSSGYKIPSVVANVSGQYLEFKMETDSLNFQNPGKEIDENDIASMINNISQRFPKDSVNIIHILPKRYILDEELVLEPVGLIGSKLDIEFNVISTRSNMLTNLKNTIQSAGVEVIDFIASPIASAAAVLFEEEKDLGIACVDIGASLTDIAVYKNGNLEYIKSIPIGGNLITADIAQRFIIDKGQAETVKKQLGLASTEYLEVDESIEILIREDSVVTISRYDLVETIEYRLGEILEIIRREIEKSGIYEKLNAGIVITGGVANTKHIQQFAQNVFEKDVRIGKPKGYKVLGDKYGLPEYATSIGMVHFILSHKINSGHFSKHHNSKNDGFQNLFNKFFDKIRELF